MINMSVKLVLEIVIISVIVLLVWLEVIPIRKWTYIARIYFSGWICRLKADIAQLIIRLLNILEDMFDMIFDFLDNL